MKTFQLISCLTLLSASVVQGASDSLEALLETVRSGHAEAAEEREARVERFTAARDQQQRLLDEARQDLEAARDHGDALKSTYVENERRLAELEAQLQEELGEMGEVFGTVRQVAREVSGLLESSAVSAQLPGRAERMQAIASQTELPAIGDLEELWQGMLEETLRAGTVETFTVPVIDPQGNSRSAAVTRIGLSGLISGGEFYKFDPEVGQVVELPAQPARYLRRSLDTFERLTGGLGVVTIDPTAAAGGSLLELEAIRPDMGERVRAGGLVGFVIIGIGFLGLVLALERFLVLSGVRRQVQKQLKNPGNPGENCIGRIIRVYQEYDTNGDKTETLEHKLDEAILREVPRLERFLPLLKILAAIAPLLGLLGTVTGMIATFQAITLHGTGDPKLMAGGISQALVTTMLGLIVAIPILLLHNVLAGLSNRLVGQLEEQSVGLIAEHSAREEGKGDAS